MRKVTHRVRVHIRRYVSNNQTTTSWSSSATIGLDCSSRFQRRSRELCEPISPRRVCFTHFGIFTRAYVVQRKQIILLRVPVVRGMTYAIAVRCESVFNVASVAKQDTQIIVRDGVRRRHSHSTLQCLEGELSLTSHGV